MEMFVCLLLGTWLDILWCFDLDQESRKVDSYLCEHMETRFNSWEISFERFKLGHLRVFTPTSNPIISFLALSLVDDDLLDICWFVGLISLFSPPMDYMIYVWVYCLIQAWGRVFYHVWWDVDPHMLCTFVYAFPCFLYFEKLQKDFCFYQGKFAMCFVLFLLWT